jgi:hypothetical protein
MSVRSLTTLVLQMRLLRKHVALERATAGLIGTLLESTAVANTAEAKSSKVLMIGLGSIETLP